MTDQTNGIGTGNGKAAPEGAAPDSAAPDSATDPLTADDVATLIDAKAQLTGFLIGIDAELISRVITQQTEIDRLKKVLVKAEETVNCLTAIIRQLRDMSNGTQK